MWGFRPSGCAPRALLAWEHHSCACAAWRKNALPFSMANRECPNCHSRIEFAAKCPYCPNCGWNRDAAIKGVRLAMRVLPVGFLGSLVSLGTVYMTSAAPHRGPAMPPFAIVFICGIPLILLIGYFSLRRKLDELKSLPEPR